MAARPLLVCVWGGRGVGGSALDTSHDSAFREPRPAALGCGGETATQQQDAGPAQPSPAQIHFFLVYFIAHLRQALNQYGGHVFQRRSYIDTSDRVSRLRSDRGINETEEK